jgi:tripartite-type tricarboxylate transporter receptor subunit TctC
MLGAWTVLQLAVMPAAADEMADFYSGKTVRVLVGFGTGGGYDLYSRTLARYMGRYIPGNPTLVVQNMPGAGSLKAVNYLYNVAPKDGTVIGHFAPGIMVEPLLGRVDGTQFEASKLSWIGSISKEVSVCAFMSSAGIKTWHDMQTKKYIIGASGAGAESDVFPTVLRNMFHLPLKIVTGYPGGTEINLAMERHEIDGRCGWSWTSLLSRSKTLLVSKKINLTLQIGLEREHGPYLDDVPAIMELTDDAAQQAALKLIVSRQSMARPFAGPPGLAADRLQSLRAAFDATLTDAGFLAEARQLDLDVRPVTGAKVEALLNEIYASPPQVVKRAADLLKNEPSP